MYKTNQAGGNSMYFNDQPGGQYGTNGWGQGTLAYLTDTNGPLGTWSFTFSQNTNVLMTSPSGLTTNCFFPDQQVVIDAFSDPVVANFGAQPNTTADIGQGIVLSHVKIVGSANPIDEGFTGSSLDPNIWTVRASQPANVFLASTDIAFSLSWTLPDNGFSLQVSPELTGPWTDPGLTNVVTSGPTKSVLVPKSVLPATNHSYFRMIKPQ
jgi:hypothetical protein